MFGGAVVQSAWTWRLWCTSALRVRQGAEAQYFGMPEGEGQDPAAALNALLHRVGQLAVRVRAQGRLGLHFIFSFRLRLDVKLNMS